MVRHLGWAPTAREAEHLSLPPTHPHRHEGTL